jgi:phosphoglycolate phosphatase
MRVSVIIFDCDGVMFDSRQANVNFYNHMLSHFGLPPLTDHNIEFVHMHTVVESLHQIFQGTPYVAEALDYRFKVDYTPFINDMVMEPGLKGLLDAIKPDYGLAVATNRSNTIGKVLAMYGLSSYFDIVVSSLDVQNPKPHPASIFKILDFFSTTPKECVYVGDSEVDLKVCQASGVPLIAYKNTTLKAQMHVQSMAEIKDLLIPSGRLNI